MRAMETVAAILLVVISSAAQPQNAIPDRAKPLTLTFSRIPAVAEPSAIALYPQAMGSPTTEVWDTLHYRKDLGFRVVRNVSHPTLTPVFPPAGKASGAAVVVVPGGGFTLLQMEMEGWTVARWLADHGIAAFVLKYRLRPTPPGEDEFTAELNQEVLGQTSGKPASPDTDAPLATEDAIAAVKLVRVHSAQWGINPSHVGMIGFSAGAMTTMGAVIEAPPADRPTFFGYIYGPMDALNIAHLYESKDTFVVPAAAPSMFAALAMDDPAFGGKGFALVDSWKQAGRPVELHAYERGGHGFGIGVPGTTSTMVMPEFLAWMHFNGFAKAIGDEQSRNHWW